MTINYKTNGAYCTKSLTEWYFGKTFVKKATDAALKDYSKTGKRQHKTSKFLGQCSPNKRNGKHLFRF